jgi:rare lipoprotein A (peptidoglycan hydrolase)
MPNRRVDGPRSGDTVLVSDRGPYIEPRVLDLSEGATYPGYAGAGVATVTAEILVPK